MQELSINLHKSSCFRQQRACFYARGAIKAISKSDLTTEDTENTEESVG